MNSGIVVDTEVASPPRVPPENLMKPDAGSRGIENWLEDHLGAIAAVTVAAGFGLRLLVASRSYLNPDEALHYVMFNQPSVLLAYKVALTSAHPPLFFLFMYFWHFLGRSELLLRLPSVLAGTAFCWFTFKWVSLFFGKKAGLISLVIATFAPALINISAEVRQYAFMLLFMSVALYFLGRSFQEKSSREMWYFTLFLYLAILSHYSAAFFVLAIGLYALVRLADASLPRKVVAAWGAGQFGALVIYALLYWSHVSRLKGVMADWASPYDRSYFHPGYGGYAELYDFLRENTARIFDYTFQEQYVSRTMFLIFIGSVVFLYVKGFLPQAGKPRSFQLGILVTLPFLAIWGAAMAGVYPYAATRHTIFLAPFSIAAIASLLTAVVRGRLWAGLLIAITLMGFSNAAANPLSSLPQADLRRALMVNAINEVQASVPKRELILVDYQSSFILAYYLCGPDQIVQIDISNPTFHQFACKGYYIISLDNHFWKLTPGNLMSQGKKMAETLHLQPGERFWVFQAGWEANLDTELPSHLPAFRCLTPKSFGSTITVIPFVLDSDLKPAPPVKDCESKSPMGVGKG